MRGCYHLNKVTCAKCGISFDFDSDSIEGVGIGTKGKYYHFHTDHYKTERSTFKW